MNTIKQLTMLLLFLKTGLVFSQNRLSGTFQYGSNSGVGNHYTEVNWQFKYNMGIENGWVVLNAYEIDIRPSATSMYRYNGKNLSRGQYGSRSPQLEPCGVNIEVYLAYNGKNYPAFIHFNCDGTTNYRSGNDEYSLRGSGTVVRVKDIGIPDVDAYSFVVQRSNMIGFNQKGDNALDKELYESELKEYNKPTNQNNSNHQGSSANPTNTNSSGNAVTNNSSSTNTTPNAPNQNNQTYTIPSAESQMIKLGIDPNKDYLGELITMGGTLLQEINENRRLRWEKEMIEAERLEKVKAENAANNTKKYLNYFEENFVNKYYQIAKEGNDTARMLLLMKTKELIIECSEQPNSSYCKFSDFSAALPDNITYPNNIQSKWDWLRQSNWLKVMCENKNIDALLFIGSIIQNEYTILNLTLPKLELAASLGSLDAMVILGMYYNGNSKIYGGSNEEKALYWLTKAANAGCPMSAYYLGMIYRYKNILGDLPINYVRKNLAFIPYYSIKKDEKIAANWFAKSIAYSKNHNESSFAKHILICERAFWSRKLSWSSMKDSYYGMAASITNPDVYIQLAEMYSKGIGVSKNSELAEQLKLEGEALYDFYKNLK